MLRAAHCPHAPLPKIIRTTHDRSPASTTASALALQPVGSPAKVPPGAAAGLLPSPSNSSSTRPETSAASTALSALQSPRGWVGGGVMIDVGVGLAVLVGALVAV